MEYFCETSNESLILEPEDWSKEKWNTILEIFGMKEAERIVISNYKFEAYGTKIDRKVSDNA